MPIWFALLVPLVGAFVMFRWFRDRLTWWETVIPTASTVLFILIFKFTIQKTRTSDTEYHGALLVSARYYEPYETWVHKTCSYECNCEKDKDGHEHCQTCYRDCSYCDETGPRYTATNSLGENFSISKDFYDYLKKKWSSKEDKIELNRDIDYHGGCGKDGDAFEIRWNGDSSTAESTTTEHTYENRVQAAHSSFDFVKVNSQDVKTYSLYKYPNVSGFQQDNLLGIDSFTWIRSEEKARFRQMSKYLNGKLGPEKHAAVQNRSRKNKCKPNDMKSNRITSAGHSSNTIVVGIPKRIFKFKFWLGHTKKMTYEHSLIEISHAHWDFTEDIIPLPFTGFKDVKGNEIYEGDILSLWYSRDTTGKDIVRFNHVVAWEDTNGFSGWNIPFLESAEIIGNVFENAELAE